MNNYDIFLFWTFILFNPWHMPRLTYIYWYVSQFNWCKYLEASVVENALLIFYTISRLIKTTSVHKPQFVELMIHWVLVRLKNRQNKHLSCLLYCKTWHHLPIRFWPISMMHNLQLILFSTHHSPLHCAIPWSLIVGEEM